MSAQLSHFVTVGLRGIACPRPPECLQSTHRVRPLSRARPLGLIRHGTGADARSTLAALVLGAVRRPYHAVVASALPRYWGRCPFHAGRAGTKALCAVPLPHRSARPSVSTPLLHFHRTRHGPRAAARSTLAALGPRRCAPCRQHPEVLGRLFTPLSHFDTVGLRGIACPVSPSACKAPTVFGPFRGLAPWG